MSLEQSIPEAGRSPYPLQPAPLEDRAADVAQNGAEEEGSSWIERATETVHRAKETKLGLGAAIGIGSAALLAALLFANRSGRKNERSASKRSTGRQARAQK